MGQGNPIWSFSGFHVERTRSWGLISADVISREPGEATWRSDRHRIVYALTDIPGAVRIGDRPAEAIRLQRNSNRLAFRPGGLPVRSDVPSAVRLIQILQSPSSFDSFACDMVRGGTVRLEPRFYDDPLIARLVLTLANDIEGGFLDHVLADTLNTALAVQIIRQSANASVVTLAPPSGLSRERLRRVRDYIETHLADRLTLTDIAAVACLSPYHLSRSFKLATGIGLHRYIVTRRVERAKDLILKTNLPLAEIACTVGFGSQPSFTVRFRREIGITPGRLRADQG
jgi:AraC family transcriptional regulator